MSPQFQSIIERVYMGLETEYGIIPAGKPAAADATRHTQVGMNNEPLIINRSDKTGSRGTTVGVGGRRSCRWDFTSDLTASGVVGTLPRLNPILECAFGQPAETLAGIVYKVADTIPSMWMASYREPGASQRIAHGLLVYALNFNLGQDAASFSASGEGQWVVESDQIGNLLPEDLGGLTTFPAEPTPVYQDGGLIIGFTGELKIQGTVMANIRSMNMSFATGNQCRRDTFGRFTPDGSEGARRSVAISMDLYDQGTAETNFLREAANYKLPILITAQVGLNPGSIYKHTFRNVQLSPIVLGDGSIRWSCSFGQSLANETTAGLKDEYELEIA
jgi:hypothetical protein